MNKYLLAKNLDVLPQAQNTKIFLQTLMIILKINVTLNSFLAMLHCLNQFFCLTFYASDFLQQCLLVRILEIVPCVSSKGFQLPEYIDFVKKKFDFAVFFDCCWF